MTLPKQILIISLVMLLIAINVNTQETSGEAKETSQSKVKSTTDSTKSETTIEEVFDVFLI